MDWGLWYLFYSLGEFEVHIQLDFTADTFKWEIHPNTEKEIEITLQITLFLLFLYFSSTVRAYIENCNQFDVDWPY